MADADMADMTTNTKTQKKQAPPPSALEQERDRLANALAQLERSNAELRRELDAQRATGVALDRDYKEALQDNVVIVAKYRARVAALEEEIGRVNSVDNGGGGGGGGSLAGFGQEPRDVGGLGVGVERGGAVAGAAAATGAAAAPGAEAGAEAARAASGSGGRGNENDGGGAGGGVWV